MFLQNVHHGLYRLGLGLGLGFRVRVRVRVRVYSYVGHTYLLNEWGKPLQNWDHRIDGE